MSSSRGSRIRAVPRRSRRGGTTTTESTSPSFGRLVLSEDVCLSTLGYSQFTALVVNGAFPHTRYAQWHTDVAAIDDLIPYALTTNRSRNDDEAVLDLQPVLGRICFARVNLNYGSMSLWLAARDAGVLAEAESWFRKAIPEAPVKDCSVRLRFWSHAAPRPRCVSRRITVHAWEDVRENYPAAVAAELESLMQRRFETAAGHLVLWHGAPGTGKTHALRALAWEWHDWCTTHYITDPEVFWGEHSSYLLDVLLREDDEDEDEDKWRLLVLEDTGELLSADAKERSGQGLSRLLNVVDGFIGQGFRVLVLVTTNEKLRSLHPAVARPGRCAARIEFKPFSAEEAAAWFERQRVDGDGRSGTLAELYACAQGLDVREGPAFGFTL